MATNTLLAADTTASTSSDVTIAAGSSLDVYLVLSAGMEEIPRTAEILVQKKNGSDYVTQFNLNMFLPSAKISGAGTYRFKRGVNDFAIGVNSET
jgi:hypothetical protein